MAVREARQHKPSAGIQDLDVGGRVHVLRVPHEREAAVSYERGVGVWPAGVAGPDACVTKQKIAHGRSDSTHPGEPRSNTRPPEADALNCEP
jgi:hypothetical protein